MGVLDVKFQIGYINVHFGLKVNANINVYYFSYLETFAWVSTSPFFKCLGISKRYTQSLNKSAVFISDPLLNMLIYVRFHSS